MYLLLNLLVSTVAVFVTSYILPGVNVDSFVTAMVVAVLMGLANAFVKPVLTILTLPLTIITLGLFTFVINAVLILIISKLVAGFQVDGFWWALAFSFVVSLINSALSSLTK